MGAKYYFDSYGDSATTQFLGSGTVETTGQKEGEYVQIKVLTNSTEQSFVGSKYWVEADAKDDGSVAYQLYTGAGTGATGMYVKIYAEQPNRTVSFTIQDSSDDSAIQGASVTIGETTKTTGSSGGCTASLKDGEYEVEVSATGYTTKTETIAVGLDDLSFTIQLTAS